LTVVQQDQIKVRQDAQEVTAADHLPYPKLIHQTNRGRAGISPIANSINHQQICWSSADRKKYIVLLFGRYSFNARIQGDRGMVSDALRNLMAQSEWIRRGRKKLNRVNLRNDIFEFI